MYTTNVQLHITSIIAFTTPDNANSRFIVLLFWLTFPSLTLIHHYLKNISKHHSNYCTIDTWHISEIIDSVPPSHHAELNSFGPFGNNFKRKQNDISQENHHNLAFRL